MENMGRGVCCSTRQENFEDECGGSMPIYKKETGNR